MSVVFIYVMLLLFDFSLWLFGRVLFAAGIHNDAKGYYNRHPRLWTLLVGVAGWIPAIIYLNRHKNSMMTVGCPYCRRVLPEPMGQCPFCGRATTLPPEDPARIVWRGKGRRQMIWGGVLWVVGFLLFCTSYILFFGAIFGNSPLSQSG